MTAFSVEMPGTVLASLVLVLLVAVTGCLAALAETGTGRTRVFGRPARALIPVPQWIPVGSTAPRHFRADTGRSERIVKVEYHRT